MFCKAISVVIPIEKLIVHSETKLGLRTSLEKICSIGLIIQ